MGGFATSKHLQNMLQWFDASGHTDEYYEALEQCIEMTKVIETGNFQDFLAFYELFNGKRELSKLCQKIGVSTPSSPDKSKNSIYLVILTCEKHRVAPSANCYDCMKIHGEYISEM